MPSSAGFVSVDLIDPASGIAGPMAVLYPTDAAERPTRIGPYQLAVAEHAEPRPGRHPLVMVSHGSGGSHLVYRALARHLAQNGFVVAMPEHPRNNRSDNSLQGTVANLVDRPRHLQRAIDRMFASERFSSCLRPEAVSIIGHSMGGYTALALAGGQPTSFPYESADNRSQAIECASDPRIRALVLLAPASVWFRADGALAGVDLPILMLTGTEDSFTPFEPHGRLILDGVADPSRVTARLIDKAGHFAFLTPFPEAMAGPQFLPAQDPPGFDRAAFQETMNEDIRAFLSRHAA